MGDTQRFETRRIVLNSDACGGCLTCEQMCSGRHFHECSSDLSAIRIQVDFYEDTFTLFNCRQCPKPACLEACPVGAILYDEERGSFYVDDEHCITCGECVKACPFRKKLRPAIHLALCDGEEHVVKCDLCHGYADGPVCVNHCPKGALTLK